MARTKFVKSVTGLPRKSAAENSRIVVTTSSAVSGEPSCHLIPARNRNVIVKLSLEIWNDSASDGSSAPFAGLTRKSESKIASCTSSGITFISSVVAPMTPMAIAPPSGPATVGVGAGAELAATVGVVGGVGTPGASARGTGAGAQAMSRPSAKSVVRNVVMLGLAFKQLVNYSYL